MTNKKDIVWLNKSVCTNVYKMNKLNDILKITYNPYFVKGVGVLKMYVNRIYYKCRNGFGGPTEASLS